MTGKAVVEGVGKYLPTRLVKNTDLEKIIDTSDEWIRTRTGIERRYFVGSGETTSTMAVAAAQNALDNAGLTADDIDGIVLATTSADLTFPSAATMVQHGLGMTRGFAFDVQAVCAGFVYAMSVANAMITSGQVRRILVIGADMLSKLVDWDDRSTCVLFGDGAGALVLGASPDADRGILATRLESDGAQKDILYMDGGASTGQTGFLRMEGKEVFRHAVDKLSSAAVNTLADAGLTTDDVNWIVPHQANKRILEGVSKRLKVPMSQIVMTVQDHGNTSAASVPLALATAHENGTFTKGDVIVIGAIGGGLAWGTAVLRW
ncbi:MAG: beta-ketoacyl-ACP synthase III [Planktomarina sp.]